MIGGQTKTPTLSVLYNGEEKYIGGAGIVAKHLKKLVVMSHLQVLLEMMNLVITLIMSLKKI